MDKRLKERLFGATILISLFVIFLPMILKEPQTEIINHNEIKPQPPIKEEKDWLEVPKPLSEWQSTIEAPVANTGDAWTVQVATFANKENADGFRAQLALKGYQAYLESVPDRGDQLTWVLVGPLKKKEEALKLQEQLKADFDVKAFIKKDRS